MAKSWRIGMRAGVLAGLALTVVGLSVASEIQDGGGGGGERAAGAGEQRVSSPVQRPARPRHDRNDARGGSNQPALYPDEFRPIDGAGTNGDHPTWGAAGVELARIMPVGYADGVDAPAGPNRPSARLVSNVVMSQGGDTPNPEGATDYLWQWGQFIDHDIDETPVTSPAQAFDIPVPTGDPYFDPDAQGGHVINLDRSAPDPNAPIRQQLNNITSFLDASNVYGSDTARANALRESDGSGALRTSANDLLPYNTGGFDNAPTGTDPTYFLAGDIRANEQIGLTAMHTLFVREHNYQASMIRALNPGLTGDEVYERARAIVGAELQAITYREFLPLLLGPGALPAYQGFKPDVDPTISNIFATAAYRIGHTMLSSELMRLGANNDVAPEGSIPLLSAFFAPNEIESHGIESILRGLAGKRAQAIDCRVVDDVRNFLFGPPGAGGFDLASLNIQRGRDHGLASYNQVRGALGMAPAATFADITPDPTVRTALASVYSAPDDVDAWVGMLCEPHRPNALVGETAWRILRDQFTRIRDGDRFWYESYLPPQLVEQVNHDTLATIIRRNTLVGPELRDDVFRMPVEPGCRADLDHDGSVSIYDFGRFASGFGTIDPACDFTGDGYVDIFDFVIFAGEFGSECAP